MTILRSATTLVVLAAMATAALAQTPKSAKPSSGSSGLRATLEKLERAGWDAFKNQDEKAYVALCAPGYTAVTADQTPPRDAQATAQLSHQIVVHSYDLSDFQVTPLGPGAALATYIASGNATFGSAAPQDFRLAVTDVYVKRAGHWKSLRYHESAIK